MNTFWIQESKPRKINLEINEFIAKQKVTMKQRKNAVVVAGDTLATIQQHPDLVEAFMDLCMNA